MNRSLASWLVGALALTAAACMTAKDTFYGTVFPCDVKATEDQCGTTSEGKPMVCYNGSRVGAHRLRLVDPRRAPEAAARGSPSLRQSGLLGREQLRHG